MKFRPILFSAPMVRALLAGTKTQTRRVVKPQPVKVTGGFCSIVPAHPNDFAWSLGVPGCTVVSCKPHGPDGWALENSPYGIPGDRLWVKETWRTGARLDGKSPKAIELACRDAGYTHGACCPVQYIADGHSTQWGDRDADDFGPWGKTRVSIHMPRWASRLTLEITGVRVERLNDISESDAIAEGVTAVSSGGVTLFTTTGVNCFQTAKDAHAALWESINGPGSWDANPWVWVVEFKRANGGEG